jgi:hypothetical protein
MNPGYGMAVDYLTRQAPENAGKLGETVAEYAGSKGMNDYASAGLGMAASIAANPLTYAPTPGVNFGLKPVSKPGIGARIGEMRSGVDAMSIERLRRDPTAFFSRADRGEAGAAIGKAKADAGVNLGVQHGNLETFTPENVQLARSPSIVGKKATTSIPDKLMEVRAANPELSPMDAIKSSGITAEEVSKALDMSSNRLSKLNSGTPAFRAESAIKDNLQSIIEIVSPEIKGANKQYSRVALRDEFMEPFPVNQSGKFSKTSALLGAPVGAGVGAVFGGYPGAVMGAGIAQGLRSPFLVGLQTAARGLADKAIDPVLGFASRRAGGVVTQLNNQRRNLITQFIENRSKGSQP